MKKIGILTSGGDCQGLNAAIRGVAKGLYEEIDDVEIYGIQNGYAGLIHGDYKKMNQSDFSGILTIGGTILGITEEFYRKALRYMIFGNVLRGLSLIHIFLIGFSPSPRSSRSIVSM